LLERGGGLGFLGSSQWSRRVWHGWYGVVASIAGGPWPEGPAQKVFKPSCGLLRLVNYKGGASAKYWAAFPASKARLGKSLIDETAVRRVAARVGCSDWGRLERACAILKDGADIGCKGMARTASFSKNAASAIQCGYQVSDAVAAWITKGFASGPFTEEEVPAGAKIKRPGRRMWTSNGFVGWRNFLWNCAWCSGQHRVPVFTTW